jgi:uncharacterized membrane protein (UPF0136 family)
MTPTTRIGYVFAVLLVLSGAFGYWMAGSAASLFTGVMLGAIVAGFARAESRGWPYAWAGSLVLAVMLTLYLGFRAAEGSSVIAAAMALVGLVSMFALLTPRRSETAS